MPSTPFHTIALVGKFMSLEAARSVRELAAWLIQRGLHPLLDSRTAQALPDDNLEHASLAEIGQRAQLAVVVGGDGTLLHTAGVLAPLGVPLVGINQGRLGFMTDIPRSDTFTALADILEGRCRTEKRCLLEARVLLEGTTQIESLALNEVVVGKSDSGRLIEFALHIDGEFIYNQRSDGLIIATATGSTAYALSANGPILHPAVSGIALVPLCPHALTARPITVPESARLSIRLAAGFEGRVHCDGYTQFDLTPQHEVEIVRSAHSLTLLHPENYSYFAMLREKLHWSEPAKP